VNHLNRRKGITYRRESVGRGRYLQHIDFACFIILAKKSRLRSAFYFENNNKT
jgi:hypothetical protein